MPDPTGQDEKDKGLPLDFFGKSYLGKDVNVGVQGESPAAAAEGAAPTGALGVVSTNAGAGPAKAAGGATGGVGGGGGSGVNDALQSVGLAQKLAKLAGSEDAASGAQGLDFGPGTSLTASLPEGQAALNAPAALSSTLDPTLSTAITSGGGLNVADAALTASLPEGQAALSAGAEAGSTAAEGAANTNAGPATAGVGILDALLSMFGGKPGQQAASVIGAGGLAAAPFFPPAALLAIPDLISLFSGHGLPGFGPPPAISFPMNNWTQLAAGVNKALPPPITVPDGASPEQKADIEAANKLINDLKGGYGGAAPPSLNGQQSAETWNNVFQDYVSGAKSRFKELQTLYPKALAATKAKADVQTLAPSPEPSAPPTDPVLAPGFFDSTAGQDEKKKQGE